MTEKRAVLDTNVFVAAGFNPQSRSAAILRAASQGQVQVVWNEATRRETERIVRKIPRLSWSDVAHVFRPEQEFSGSVDPGPYGFVEDPEDRKYAALAEAAGCPLVTNDDHLLTHRDRLRVPVQKPSEFWPTGAESD